jgi:hypothetical protein
VNLVDSLLKIVLATVMHCVQNVVFPWMQEPDASIVPMRLFCAVYGNFALYVVHRFWGPPSVLSDGYLGSSP